jgi:hypothetical protein
MAVVVVVLQLVVMMLLLIHRVLVFRRHVLWHQDGREFDCT